MITGLQPDDERISVQLQEREKGQIAGILTISSLERTDDGLYACIASNKVYLLLRKFLKLWKDLYFFNNDCIDQLFHFYFDIISQFKPERP